jgi:hypothetical protein
MATAHGLDFASFGRGVRASALQVLSDFAIAFETRCLPLLLHWISWSDADVHRSQSVRSGPADRQIAYPYVDNHLIGTIKADS